MRVRSRWARHKCYLRERLELLRSFVNLEDEVIENALQAPGDMDRVLVEILAEEPHLLPLILSRGAQDLRRLCMKTVGDRGAFRYQRACALLVLSLVPPWPPPRN